MPDKAQGRVYITGDARGFHVAMRKATWEAMTFQQKMMTISGQMKRIGRAMTYGVTMPIVAGLGLSVKAAIEENRQMAIMESIIRKNTGATHEQVGAIEKWIARQQSLTNFADGETRPALQALVVATKDIAEAQKLAALAMDISAATGKPLLTVSQALAKAHNGNIGALGRLGIATKDASGKTKSFAQIQSDAMAAYGGAARTAADPMVQLRNAIADLSEDIGRVLAPTVLSLAEKMRAWAERLSALSSGQKTMLVVVALIAAAIPPLVLLFGSVVGIIGTLAATVTVAGVQMSLFGAIMHVALGPIGLVVLAIAAVVTILVIAYRKNETFRAIVQKVWAAVKGSIAGVWAAIKIIFGAMVKAYGTLRAALSGLSRAAAGTWDAITTAFRNGYYNTVSWINRMIEKINWLLEKLHLAKVGSITGGAAPVSTGRRGGIQEFASGGIADGPRSGYLAMLHGREAVIPLGNGNAAGMGQRVFNITIDGYNKSVHEIIAEIESYERRMSRGV